jgi:pimeloyl-ACP methyl ester carboxylesterase
MATTAAIRISVIADLSSPGRLAATLSCIHCQRNTAYLGWSLGGQIAMRLAQQQPDRVQSVSLLGE